MKFDRKKLMGLWSRVKQWRPRWVKVRGKAVRRMRELEEYVCDSLTVALEEATWNGRFSRGEVQAMYQRIGTKAELPSLVPKKQLTTKRHIEGLKKELKHRNKAGNNATKFNTWDKDKPVVPNNGKKRANTVVNIRKPAA